MWVLNKNAIDLSLDGLAYELNRDKPTKKHKTCDRNVTAVLEIQRDGREIDVPRRFLYGWFDSIDAIVKDHKWLKESVKEWERLLDELNGYSTEYLKENIEEVEQAIEYLAQQTMSVNF